MRKVTSHVGVVFWVSLAISLAFVLWGMLGSGSFVTVTDAVLRWIVSSMSWFYMLVANVFLVFVVYLGFSRYGKIKLGGEDDEPEFGRFSWFAMMFQVGMGPAIVFWCVTEPLSHYAAPPFGLAEPRTPEAAQVAMQYSFFHWTLHPWAIYAVVGLAVAYFVYRRNERGLISAIFRPWLGDRVDGPVGKTIDILAILAVLFGIAVDLGQAGLQVTAGLGQVFGTPAGLIAQLVVIGVTTAAFMVSAATPIDKGVKWLSNTSMILAPVLLLYFFVFGPTVTQLDAFTQGIGDYLGNIIPMSMSMDAFDKDAAWLGTWTVFYWSWWVAWAPYVGLFMARISRGRTIREFILGVVLAPSLFTVVWFVVFGGSAISVDGALGGRLSETAGADPAAAMFLFVEQFPLATLVSVAVILVLWVFFVAGADAGTIVLGEMSTGGDRNPARPVRLSWGLAMAAVASILLVAGGLDGLRTASILAGLPFALIMVAMCVVFYKYLSREAGGEDQSPGRDDLAERKKEKSST